MLKTLKKIFKTGVITEPLKNLNLEDKEFELIGCRCKEIINARFKGSLAIRHVDAGSCNGCELEIHALNNAFYNIERFGIHFVASPRHADLLLVTGPVSKHMEEALIITYNATPEPKLVLAVGECGATGGEFKNSYATKGAVQNVIPVDAVIHGCPPTPLTLLKGILTLLESPKNHGKK